MDEAVIKQIQREGADALLDIGVSVPLKAFHIPFRKSPLELRVTMRRPYMSGQILFARTYLSMGITSEGSARRRKCSFWPLTARR